MTRSIAMFLGLAMSCVSAAAEAPKLPIESNDQGSIYVSPNVSSTEKSADMHGATLGVQNSDGSGAHGGIDPSGARPTYSAGGSTGGDVSFSLDAHSDGKKDVGAKAGVKIKY